MYYKFINIIFHHLLTVQKGSSIFTRLLYITASWEIIVTLLSFLVTPENIVKNLITIADEMNVKKISKVFTDYRHSMNVNTYLKLFNS